MMVNYDVVKIKYNLLEKSLRWIRSRMPKSKVASIRELKERGLAFDAPKPEVNNMDKAK